MRRILTCCAVIAVSLGAGCAAQPATPASVAPSSVESDNESQPDDTESPSTMEEPEEGTPTPKPSPTPEGDDAEKPSATATEEPSETAAAVLLKPGDTDAKVRDLQHRLLQINWYEGEITENFGPATQAAVEGFQAKRGLTVTGELDETTYERLVEMTREPTDDELHNRMQPGPSILKEGSTGAEVRDLQARLRQIGWFTGDVTNNYGPQTKESVSGFQEKRGFPITGEVDQRTLDRLHEMTSEPTEDELANRMAEPEDEAMQLDERCLTGRAVCISKDDNQLAWVVDGKIQLQFDVRFGSELTPTREGTFAVEWKSRDHVSSLYGSKMPFALFFSGGQAVHYSADFASRGYNGASHGCVNVRDREGAEQLFDLTKVGDKVIVY